MKKIILLLVMMSVSLSFSQITGTWKISPQAVAMGVGPVQGDTSWWANSAGDITARACFFDDEYVFNADGTFKNVLGTQTWVETWQGALTDGCAVPVAPHDGSNAATWVYDTTANTITLTGVGAYLGLAKAYNGGELASPAGAPASITYKVTTITASLVTLDIQIANGWWRFILAKQGVAPTCSDGIMNGTETGIDCGGTCSNPCLQQINLPVTFEDPTVDYTVIDFGGNSSTKVVDPTNPNNTVIKTDKTLVAQTWAGTTIGSAFSSAIPFTSTSTKINIRVWSPTAGTPIRLKVEDPADPTHSCETDKNTTVANGWQTMEFDFANQATGTAPLNLSYIFKRASIFFNMGTDGATAGLKTYYFDDVNFGAALATDTFELSNIKMFPNPTSNNFTIESKNAIDTVSVYDILGRQVKTNNPKSNRTTIDISSLQSGIYVVKATIDGKTSSSKIVKN